MSNFNEQAPTVNIFHEDNERLYGASPDQDTAVDISVNRFAPTDNYTPPDISKNPAALYAFEKGFDELFPAALLTRKLIGRRAVASETSAVITTPELAMWSTKKISDPQERDHARSSIALHYLYSEREDRLTQAEAVLEKISDLGFATHVLAQIVKAGDEHVVALDTAHRKEVEEDLRKKAKALAELHDAHLADILGEAAEVLHDQKLHDQATQANETNMSHAPTTETAVVNTQRSRAINPENEDDDAVKVDMSAYL